ncbi:MAG TPA: 16S rRNA (cytosine(1402)-N(4))-methyltransferase RsmH [Saprospiraceae bacterium]|jgi:16S rRNA (cytosine1402-N4)-methyltransferase|nr:16S rRNA (cytosine(1402)-N(4))-methyltransferase RsmH [Saprospiraceae bacterium]
MSEYHVSVLLDESIKSLSIRPDGKYVDVTFGAGGHSRSILNELSAKGHLYAFDQDEDAVENIIHDTRFTLIEANFRYLKRFLRLEGISEVDGILADLGVSSHQLDFPERGFSYRFDAPLDMRMNIKSDMSAADLLRTYSEESLVEILSNYGEVRNSKSLAKAIINARKFADIKTTFDFNRVLDQNVMGLRLKYFSQVYQALRMEVNDEIGALKDMLEDGLAVLKPGGRFSVITFHSIEDRVVKNFFKSGNFDGEVEKDEFGNIQKPFSLVNKKVIMADSKEQKVNVRSRSAKLRVAEKI